ncbi:MAG: HDOD domain-containing protein [Phycisphaerales bacterium]
MASILSNVSARNAAFALYQLETPAVHPDSVIQCIKSVTEYRPALTNLVQTDPAVAIAMFSLCRQSNIEFSFEDSNLEHHINRIPAQKILKTFLNLKTFDVANLHSQIPIIQLNRISAARAFAARLIARKTNANENLSFLAALFADIGLLALAELYPKSLARMFEDANGDCLTLLKLEKENLGLTHNVISRQLAQKWLLPQAVADSAWLYCSPAAEKLENLANIKIVLTVRLADMLVKNINTGSHIAIPSALSISVTETAEIKEKVRNFVSQLNTFDEKQDAIIKQALISLLETPSQQIFDEFQNTVWNAVKPAVSAIEAGGIICNLLCKKLNIAKACIYLNAKKDAVKTADNLTEFLNFENSPLAQQIGFSNSALKIKLEDIGEIFIETSQNFDFAPLISIISQILSAKSAEEYNLSIAQALLDNFTSPALPQIQQQQIEPPVEVQPPVQAALPQAAVQSPDEMREIIAEIAAGAAHELNNPLTVISGRAQLLKQQETDETKLLMLNQIAEKTDQAYEIVGQLMNYARPPKPQIRTVSPFIMINNCLEKVNAHYLNEPLDITLDDSIENLNDIEADAEQIAEALAQIIYNSLESYESGNGPVIISGSSQLPDYVQIRVQDQGCGMSEETLQKASEPFYSDKPAGRQRGMGLALAASLLRNNNCKLSFESEIDKGTIVSILLPKSGKSV